MKWTYNVEQKFKMALALAVVFGLVLATNMINKNHFSRLQESFASVYEDRLLVENYIFKISRLLNKKRRITNDTLMQKASAINDSIAIQVHDYERTKFTNLETELFDSLKANLVALKQLEYQFQFGKSEERDIHEKIEGKYERLAAILSGLSDVQIKEGENLINSSNDIIATNNSFSRIEIVLLIIVGLIVQVLVFSSKSMSSKFPQKQGLN